MTFTSQRSHNLQQGFSLLEIMIALLVVSVGVVAIIGLLSTSLDSSAKAHDDLNAVSFADMVFNYCHASDWSDIPTSEKILIPDYSSNTNKLVIGKVTPFESSAPNVTGTIQNIYSLTYHLHIAEYDNTKELTLQIWPGLSTNGSKRIFYTEIYNWSKN